MFRKSVVIPVIALGLALTSLAIGQTVVAIGQGEAGPSGVATVPVHLTTDTPLSALSLRLRYDPSVLAVAGVVAGPILHWSHRIRYLAPAGPDGLLNVIVYPDPELYPYSPAGATPFASVAGTVVELVFRVRDNAVSGSSTDIVFETPGSPRLRACELSDQSGNCVLPDNTVNGRVFFTTGAKNWMLFD